MRRSCAQISVIALAALALPCEAAQWEPLRRNAEMMLSVDSQSIIRYGEEASVDYLVDFRKPQGDARDAIRFHSILVSAKVRCKAKTMALVSTTAYPALGGRGIAVARDMPRNRQEAAFKPLEKGSSDEEVWNFVCEGKKPAPLK